MNYILRQIASEDSDQPIEIHLIANEVPIGRKRIISLEKYPQVSRDHAVFYKTGDGNLFVKDLNSSNGLYVNNIKIGSFLKPLSVGDIIGFGVSSADASEGFVCTVCIDSPAAKIKKEVPDETDTEVGPSNAVANKPVKRSISTDSDLGMCVPGNGNARRSLEIQYSPQVQDVSLVSKNSRNSSSKCVVPLIKCDSEIFEWPPDVQNAPLNELQDEESIGYHRKRARILSSDSSSAEDNSKKATEEPESSLLSTRQNDSENRDQKLISGKKNYDGKVVSKTGCFNFFEESLNVPSVSPKPGNKFVNEVPNFKSPIENIKSEFKEDPPKTFYSEVEEVIFISDDESYLDFNSHHLAHVKTEFDEMEDSDDGIYKEIFENENEVASNSAIAQNLETGIKEKSIERVVGPDKTEPEGMGDSDDDIYKEIFENGNDQMSNTVIAQNQEADVKVESIELVQAFVNSTGGKVPQTIERNVNNEMNSVPIIDVLSTESSEDSDSSSSDDDRRILYQYYMDQNSAEADSSFETATDNSAKQSSKILLIDPQPMSYRPRRLRGRDEGFVEKTKQPSRQNRRNSGKMLLESERRHKRKIGDSPNRINTVFSQKKWKRSGPKKMPIERETTNTNFKIPRISRELIPEDDTRKKMNLKNVSKSPSNFTNSDDSRKRTPSVKTRPEKFCSRMGFLVNDIGIKPQNRTKSVVKSGTPVSTYCKIDNVQQPQSVNMNELNVAQKGIQLAKSQTISETTNNSAISTQTPSSNSALYKLRNPELLKSFQENSPQKVPTLHQPVNDTPTMVSLPLPSSSRKTSDQTGSSSKKVIAHHQSLNDAFTVDSSLLSSSSRKTSDQTGNSCKKVIAHHQSLNDAFTVDSLLLSSSSRKTSDQTGNSSKKVIAQTGNGSEKVIAQTGNGSEKVIAHHQSVNDAFTVDSSLLSSSSRKTSDQTGNSSKKVIAQTGNSSEKVIAHHQSLNDAFTVDSSLLSSSSRKTSAETRDCFSKKITTLHQQPNDAPTIALAPKPSDPRKTINEAGNISEKGIRDHHSSMSTSSRKASDETKNCFKKTTTHLQPRHDASVMATASLPNSSRKASPGETGENSKEVITQRRPLNATSSMTPSQLPRSSRKTPDEKGISSKNTITLHKPLNEASAIASSSLASFSRRASDETSNSLPFNLSFDGLVKTFLTLNTTWLQQQAQLDDPPLAVKKYAQFLPLSFKSFESYSSCFYGMMMLEIWEYMYLESRTGNKLFYFSVLSSESKEDCIELKCESVVNEKVCLPPREGILAIFDLKERSNMCSRLFGYIFKHRTQSLNLDSLKIPEWKKLPEEWLNNAKHWTFSVFIRKKEMSIASNSLMKGKGICYIRSKLRLADALHFVKKSPLLTDILIPRESTFSTNCSVSPSTREYTSHQMEVINGIVAEINKPLLDPKIILLHGPPGTGKTHSIIGLIETLFYSSKQKSNFKILVTAPSNVAIDEIGLRLIELNEQSSWRDSSIKFVRVGLEKQVHPKIIPYFLDRKARDLHQLNSQTFRRKEKELLELRAELARLEKQFPSADRDERIKYVTEQRNFLQKHSSVKEADYYTDMTYKIDILKESHIILSTLSSCGLSVLVKNFKPNTGPIFSCCIVDESTQCTELEILQPLVFDISKLILVGDFEQLPPTVLSKHSVRYGLERSMFERFHFYFEDSPKKSPMLVLNEQFRMHSSICDFPSRYIYAGNLATHPDTPLRYKDFPLNPYIVLEIGQNIKPSGSAIFNVCEFLVDVVDSSSSIGIITSHQAQRFFCVKTLHRNSRYSEIEIHNIDAFQGREKDIIILSTPEETDLPEGLNFMNCKRQFNVALTRARKCLIVCVLSLTLHTYPHWKALVDDARKRNLYFAVPSVTALFAVLENSLRKR